MTKISGEISFAMKKYSQNKKFKWLLAKNRTDTLFLEEGEISFQKFSFTLSEHFEISVQKPPMDERVTKISPYPDPGPLQSLGSEFGQKPDPNPWFKG